MSSTISSPLKLLGQFEPDLGGLLKKLYTEFDSIKKSGCHGNKMEFSDFEMISQEAFLDDPFQKLFVNFSFINMAQVSRGFLH